MRESLGRSTKPTCASSSCLPGLLGQRPSRGARPSRRTTRSRRITRTLQPTEMTRRRGPPHPPRLCQRMAQSALMAARRRTSQTLMRRSARERRKRKGRSGVWPPTPARSPRPCLLTMPLTSAAPTLLCTSKPPSLSGSPHPPPPLPPLPTTRTRTPPLPSQARPQRPPRSAITPSPSRPRRQKPEMMMM